MSRESNKLNFYLNDKDDEIFEQFIENQEDQFYFKNDEIIDDDIDTNNDNNNNNIQTNSVSTILNNEIDYSKFATQYIFNGIEFKKLYFKDRYYIQKRYLETLKDEILYDISNLYENNVDPFSIKNTIKYRTLSLPKIKHYNEVLEKYIEDFGYTDLIKIDYNKPYDLITSSRDKRYYKKIKKKSLTVKKEVEKIRFLDKHRKLLEKGKIKFTSHNYTPKRKDLKSIKRRKENTLFLPLGIYSEFLNNKFTDLQSDRKLHIYRNNKLENEYPDSNSNISDYVIDTNNSNSNNNNKGNSNFEIDDFDVNSRNFYERVEREPPSDDTYSIRNYKSKSFFDKIDKGEDFFSITDIIPKENNGNYKETTNSNTTTSTTTTTTTTDNDNDIYNNVNNMEEKQLLLPLEDIIQIKLRKRKHFIHKTYTSKNSLLSNDNLDYYHYNNNITNNKRKGTTLVIDDILSGIDKYSNYNESKDESSEDIDMDYDLNNDNNDNSPYYSPPGNQEAHRDFIGLELINYSTINNNNITNDSNEIENEILSITNNSIKGKSEY